MKRVRLTSQSAGVLRDGTVLTTAEARAAFGAESLEKALGKAALYDGAYEPLSDVVRRAAEARERACTTQDDARVGGDARAAYVFVLDRREAALNAFVASRLLRNATRGIAHVALLASARVRLYASEARLLRAARVDVVRRVDGGRYRRQLHINASAVLLLAAWRDALHWPVDAASRDGHLALRSVPPLPAPRVVVDGAAAVAYIDVGGGARVLLADAHLRLAPHAYAALRPLLPTAAAARRWLRGFAGTVCRRSGGASELDAPLQLYPRALRWPTASARTLPWLVLRSETSNATATARAVVLRWHALFASVAGGMQADLFVRRVRRADQADVFDDFRHFTRLLAMLDEEEGGGSGQEEQDEGRFSRPTLLLLFVIIVFVYIYKKYK